MLVKQENRNNFLSFIKNHIIDYGYGLILTMRNDEIEMFRCNKSF